LALAGIRVLDFTHFVAGPFCTQILADLGAEVIKVEKPKGGDDFRHQTTASVGGDSLLFMWTNRNKKSVAIDLASETGRELARRLAREVDVVVENFSAGVMDRMGLDYESLKAANPRLVYCAVSAAGREGPMAGKLGFDPVAQAESGLMSLTGPQEGDGMMVGFPVVDTSVAMMAGNAILAALVARATLGVGQYIDVSMFDTAVQLASYRAMGFLATGQEPVRTGNSYRTSTPVGVYPTASGPIYLACANERTWRRLAVDVLERPDLAEHPSYATMAGRVANYDSFNETLSAILRSRPREHWLERMVAEGVPAGAVATIAEAFTGDAVRERELLSALPHASGQQVPNVAQPFRFSLTPLADPVAAPQVGEHTDEILSALLDLPAAQLSAMREAGTIGGKTTT
jgi:formyl-CoA transferase